MQNTMSGDFSFYAVLGDIEKKWQKRKRRELNVL